MKSLIVGGSGLVGGQVLSSAPFAIHVLGRKAHSALPAQHEEHVVDPVAWPEIIFREKPAVVINCLGTTIKKAGSKDAFSAVDYSLVVAVAEAAKQAGAVQMISVSSVGAYAGSANFYLSIKGRAEDRMRALNFARLDILRPGLLRGQRSEHRAGEALAQMVAPLTDSLTPSRWSRYRSITAEDVATAIVNLTARDGAGQFIHENDAIRALAS